MVVIRATSAFLFLALTACAVGEVPSGGAPPVDAPPGGTPDGPVGMMPDAPVGADPAATFLSDIKPMLMSSGCLSCHPALNKPDFGSFSKLDAAYLVKPGTASLLVTKGDHNGIKYLDEAKKKIMSDWLDTVPAQ